ncbi:MAG: hypothetical protein H0V17_14755 [Deltaproteobacteria bacterium]|nr:hypothetical protein [Deltaproteobacteria bacterium]
MSADLVIGSSGEFTVWVDSAKVAEKTAGKFPEPASVVAAVRAAQSPA